MDFGGTHPDQSTPHQLILPLLPKCSHDPLGRWGNRASLEVAEGHFVFCALCEAFGTQDSNCSGDRAVACVSPLLRASESRQRKKVSHRTARQNFFTGQRCAFRAATLTCKHFKSKPTNASFSRGENFAFLDATWHLPPLAPNALLGWVQTQTDPANCTSHKIRNA